MDTAKVKACLKKVPDSVWVLVMGGLGLLVGALLQTSSKDGDDAHKEAMTVFVAYLKLPADMWLKSLVMVVAPFMVTNMSASVAEVKQLQGAGSLGKISVLWYALTTLCACILGVVMSSIILINTVKQTENFPASVIGNNASAATKPLTKVAELKNPALVPRETIDSLIPKNFTAALSTNDFLAIITVSIIMGLMLRVPPPPKVEDEALEEGESKEEGTYYLYGFLKELNDVCFTAISKLVLFTPFAIFSMMIGVAHKTDMSEMAGQMLLLYATVWAGQAVHALVTVPLLYFFFTRRLAFPLMKGVAKALLVALSTASSAATLPVTIAMSIQNNKVRPSIAKFVCSLGATVNMDGSGIYFCSVAVFIMLSRGLSPTFGQLVVVAVMSTLMSCGASPIPGAGAVVFFAAILQAVGVTGMENSPVFAVCIAFDWLGDRPATMVNVLGDSVGCKVVNTYAETHGVVNEMDSQESAVDEHLRRRKPSLMSFANETEKKNRNTWNKFNNSGDTRPIVIGMANRG